MFEGIGGAILLALLDMVVVFLVLGGLAVVLVVLKKIIGAKEEKGSGAKEMKVTPPPINRPLVIEKEEDKGELLAVITAAVASYEEKPVGKFKVVSLKRYESSALNPWIVSGRQELMLGKNIKY